MFPTKVLQRMENEGRQMIIGRPIHGVLELIWNLRLLNIS